MAIFMDIHVKFQGGWLEDNPFLFGKPSFQVREVLVSGYQADTHRIHAWYRCPTIPTCA